MAYTENEFLNDIVRRITTMEADKYDYKKSDVIEAFLLYKKMYPNKTRVLLLLNEYLQNAVEANDEMRSTLREYRALYDRKIKDPKTFAFYYYDTLRKNKMRISVILQFSSQLDEETIEMLTELNETLRKTYPFKKDFEKVYEVLSSYDAFDGVESFSTWILNQALFLKQNNPEYTLFDIVSKMGISLTAFQRSIQRKLY